MNNMANNQQAPPKKQLEEQTLEEPLFPWPSKGQDANCPFSIVLTFTPHGVKSSTWKSI